MGSAQTPVAGIIAQEVSVIDDNNNVTTLVNSDGVLAIDTEVEIAGKVGGVISGVGSVNESGNEIAMFTSETEIESDSNLVWNSDSLQLGVGGLTEIEGIGLNVESGLRVAGQVIINGEELDVTSYLDSSDLETAIDDIEYSEIKNIPTLSLYELTSSVDAKLALYDTSAEVSETLEGYSTIASMNEEVAVQMEDYVTEAEMVDDIELSLVDYMKSTDVDSGYIDDLELESELAKYPTTNEVSRILEDYVEASDIAAVGYSGSFDDLIDVPDYVTNNAFQEHVVYAEATYATKVELETTLDTATYNLEEAIMTEVVSNYAQFTDIEGYENGFVTIPSWNLLEDVAFSAQYDDLIGTPNLDVYLLIEDAITTFMKRSDIVATLSQYVTQEALSDYPSVDTIDAEITELMMEYVTSENLLSYITEDELSATMNELKQ